MRSRASSGLLSFAHTSRGGNKPLFFSGFIFIKLQYNLFVCSQFFKPRNYLSLEFASCLSRCRRLLEAGCGHGCSLIPLLSIKREDSEDGLTFYASDYCSEALDILRRRLSDEDASRFRGISVWDITSPPPANIAAFRPDAILCIFTLSAVHPKHHLQSLRHLASLLAPGGHLLFRDYGIADMTMYRHEVCLEPLLMQRADKTLAYYFSTEYLRELISQVPSLAVEELKYARVLLKNRKKDSTSRRVFLHAVFRHTDLAVGDDSV